MIFPLWLAVIILVLTPPVMSLVMFLNWYWHEDKPGWYWPGAKDK